MYEVLWRRLLLSSLYNDLVMAPTLSGVIVSAADIEGIAEVTGWRLENKIEQAEFVAIYSEWLRSLPRGLSDCTLTLEQFAEAFSFDSYSLSQAVTFVMSAGAGVMGVDAVWADMAARIFALLDPHRTATITVDNVFWLVLATVDDEMMAETDPKDVIEGAIRLLIDAEAIEGRLTHTGFMRYCVLRQLPTEALTGIVRRLECLASRLRLARLSLPEAGFHTQPATPGVPAEQYSLPDLWFTAVTLTESRGQAAENPAIGPVSAFLYTRAAELRSRVAPKDTAPVLAEQVGGLQGAAEIVYFVVDQYEALVQSVCAAIGVGTRRGVVRRPNSAVAARSTVAEAMAAPLSDGAAVEQALMAAEWVDIIPRQLAELAAIPASCLPPVAQVANELFPSKRTVSARSSARERPETIMAVTTPAECEDSVCSDLPPRGLVLDGSEPEDSEPYSTHRAPPMVPL